MFRVRDTQGARDEEFYSLVEAGAFIQARGIEHYELWQISPLKLIEYGRTPTKIKRLWPELNK